MYRVKLDFVSSRVTAGHIESKGYSQILRTRLVCMTRAAVLSVGRNCLTQNFVVIKAEICFFLDFE